MIVCAAAEKSNTLTVVTCPSTALAVVSVMVSVAAELFVTVVSEAVTATVAAFPEAVTAVFVITSEAIVCVPANVCAASILAAEKLASGYVTVLAAVGPAYVIC